MLSDTQAKLAREAEQHAVTQADKRDLHRRYLQLQESCEKMTAKMAYFTKESRMNPGDLEDALVLVAEVC